MVVARQYTGTALLRRSSMSLLQRILVTLANLIFTLVFGRALGA